MRGLAFRYNPASVNVTLLDDLSSPHSGKLIIGQYHQPFLCLWNIILLVITKKLMWVVLCGYL